MTSAHSFTQPKAAPNVYALALTVLSLLILLSYLWRPAAPAFSPDESKHDIFVFLPHKLIQTTTLEDLLSSQWQGFDVSVFTRAHEFARAYHDHQPDSIITLPPLAASLVNYDLSLQGFDLEQHLQEPYVMITKKSTYEPSHFSLGVVDQIGKRKQLKNYVAEVFKRGGKAQPRRVVSVNKLEDLLTLLQHAAVDAIMVPQSKAELLRSRSRMALETISLAPAEVGFPVLLLGELDSRSRQHIENTVRNMPEPTRLKLGVCGFK